MEAFVSRLLKEFENGRMTRRQLIQALACAAAAAGSAGVRAQSTTPFKAVRLDHISYQVPDYRRTRDFYAGLIGMSVEADNSKDYCQLQFGDVHNGGARARSFLSLRTPAAGNGQPVTPRIDHLAFAIDEWDTTRVSAELERRGFTPRLAPAGDGDTPNYVSFYVVDPNGIELQISGIARPGDALYKRP
ncbi:MAG: VOC family protein [Acidobacteria bacterium]|nr:VOC family protein [Acidobacteriota bacterium]